MRYSGSNSRGRGAEPSLENLPALSGRSPGRSPYRLDPQTIDPRQPQGESHTPAHHKKQLYRRNSNAMRRPDEGNPRAGFVSIAKMISVARVQAAPRPDR